MLGRWRWDDCLISKFQESNVKPGTFHLFLKNFCSRFLIFLWSLKIFFFFYCEDLPFEVLSFSVRKWRRLIQYKFGEERWKSKGGGGVKKKRNEREGIYKEKIKKEKKKRRSKGENQEKGKRKEEKKKTKKREKKIGKEKKKRVEGRKRGIEGRKVRRKSRRMDFIQ